MLGGKGKALVFVIGGFIDEIRSMMGTLIMSFANFNQIILEIRHSLGLVSKEGFGEILTMNNKLKGIATNLKKPVNEFRKELESTNGSLDGTIGKLKEFLGTLEEKALISAKQVEEILNKLKGATQETKNVGIELSKIKENILTGFKKDFESINATIAKMATSGIKSFSRGLAESIVLGKELNMTMQEIAKKLLVEMLAFTIQIVIQETIRNALKKEQVKDEGLIVASLRAQTSEMKKQAFFSGASNFLSTGSIFARASGGSVQKGQPYMVGERGAELFVPNQSGQIQQSARGGNGGSTTVNFNINTVDASGFDELLVRNRGTITALINNAVNERGSKNLI